MDRRTFLIVTGAAACSRNRTGPTAVRQRGLAFDGFRAQVTAEDFLALRALGATHVAMTVWAFMSDPREPTIRASRRRPSATPFDDTLLEQIRLAREAGLAVYLVPTINDFRRDRHRFDIEMPTEAAWDNWFADYAAFAGGVANAAQQAGVEGLAVGMELRRTVRHEEGWGQVIRTVRDEFGGWLTYAANWDDYDEVPWWPEVDYLGVQAYFELGTPPANAGPEERQAYLRRRWQPVRDRLSAASRRAGRPVLFSEIGYESRVGATARPWDWRADGLPDNDLQADAYAAALEAFWDQSWFAGMYWWKWYARGRLGRRDLTGDYTPQHKAAESVLARWYGGTPLRPAGESP